MSHNVGHLFMWHSVDVRSILPRDWQGQLLNIAKSSSIDRQLFPTSVTSRESDDVESVPVSTVGGIELADQAPWLDDLYRGHFRHLAELNYGTQVFCAQNLRIGMNLNVQRHGMRYEAHVDSNPIEGLLYVTTHPPGRGGELVVSNRAEAFGIREIDRNASVIYPVEGNLIFFDARNNPHYVRRLEHLGETRVVVAMNFYTAECSENDRPADLNRHLFGEI